MDYIVLFDVATKPSPWLDLPWPFSLVMLCYNSGETTPALTDCSTISPGLWVRVSYHYYGNPILRLEATRDSLDRVNAAFE